MEALVSQTMRLLILTLSVAGSLSVCTINGCLDSGIVGFEHSRGHSTLGFEALLLCSFLQLATGLIGGVIVHHQLGAGKRGFLGAILLLFSMLLSGVTASFDTGGALNGAAALLVLFIKDTHTNS